MAEYRVDKLIVGRHHPAFKQIDDLSYRSKLLYNKTLWVILSGFEEDKTLPNQFRICNDFVDSREKLYYNLNTKCSQQIVRNAVNDFDNYLKAKSAYLKDKEKFQEEPKQPRYKNKYGRYVIPFNIQTVSGPKLKCGKLRLSGIDYDFKIPTPVVDLEKKKNDGSAYTTKSLKEVWIVPRHDCYLIVVKHEVPEANKPKKLKPNNRCAGVDIGLNNLATVVTNIKGVRPYIINGRPLKSINAHYNKLRAKLLSVIDKNNCSVTRSCKQKARRKLKQITRIRNARVEDFLQKSSRQLVSLLVSQNVTRLVIGKNVEWKQEINLGKRTNQNFCFLPHARFIDMVTYKFRQAGGTVTLQEESYTSKCSFLDGETPEKHETYAGRRVKRGLFRTADGHLINADVNGGANILKKAIGNAFDHWSKDDLIKGFVVYPLRMTAYTGCR